MKLLKYCLQPSEIHSHLSSSCFAFTGINPESSRSSATPTAWTEMIQLPRLVCEDAISRWRFVHEVTGTRTILLNRFLIIIIIYCLLFRYIVFPIILVFQHVTSVTADLMQISWSSQQISVRWRWSSISGCVCDLFFFPSLFGFN